MLDRKIAIVSTNNETLDSVQEYLRRAGALPSTASRIEDAVRLATAADAVLFFADDFPRKEALRAAGSLCAKLLVIVTQEVDAFGSRSGPRGPRRVVVLRRPAWGWMLLDAVRSGTVDVAGDR